MSNFDALHPPKPEQNQPYGHDVILHNSELELPAVELYGRDEAVEKWGINGNVMSVIKLPGDSDKGVKHFAVVDYGHTNFDDAPYMFANQDGPITFIGKSPDRYVLVGLTHSAKNQLFAFFPLKTGETAVGRNDQRQNCLLGLSPAESNVEKISRQHLTVNLDEHATITITDHSTNGTIVEIARTQEESGVTRQHRKVSRPIGSVAIGHPGVLSASDSAKALFKQARDEEWLLGGSPGLDSLIADMDPNERQAFENWQIEQAAIRPTSLWEVVDKSPKNEMGTRVVPEALIASFKQVLEGYGASQEAPTQEQIEAGIEQAKGLVGSGQVLAKLKSEPFIDDYADFRLLTRGTKGIGVDLKDTMYVDPKLICGATGFTSWAGRGQDGAAGKAYTKANGEHVTDSSLSAITDYATRPSQLPSMEYLALSLVITNKGPVFFSSLGGHRSAAAKLRNEQLKFSSLTIYDGR